MQPANTIQLEFHPERHDLGKGKKLWDGLSVALQIGQTLWVANDETISLERLTLIKDGNAGPYRYAREHTQFSLHDYLTLPIPPSGEAGDVQEVDIEGLAYADGYLWLVGSHSRKRKKPKLEEGAKQAQKQLAKINAEGNRYLLARIPVVSDNGTYTLAKKHRHEGKKFIAAQLPSHEQGNDLTDALANDKHLAPFLAIPGKDNGFDIEGLAVVGNRLFIGLRGPVLRGWAVILEVEIEEDPAQPSRLKLQRIGQRRRSYHKHFLQLGGLGIRDLCIHGSDLLILAGPTMDLDGPVTVFRWRNGITPEQRSMVPASELERVMDLPFGQGVDHPEGITLLSSDQGGSQSLLVVCDAAAPSRQMEGGILVADVFPLPASGKTDAT